MIPPTVKIFVCTQPQDMRRSFDGLALATRQVLGEDPRGGALFVFANRRCRQLRVLWWDGSGYNLLCRRLHQALFRLPTPGAPSDRSAARATRGAAWARSSSSAVPLPADLAKR